MSASDRAFVDTNVLIYAVGSPSLKRERAEALLLSLSHPVISAQVISEFVSACLKKRVLPAKELRAAAQDFMDVLDVRPIDINLLRHALDIHARYGFSWWDSLIVGAALGSGCDVLYSEDLQHGQHIGDRLRIVNPFLVAERS